MLKLRKKGWVFMAGFMTWATILAGCDKWPGNKDKIHDSEDTIVITRGTPVEITEVQEISYSEHYSYVALVTNATLCRTKEGTLVKLELEYQEEYEMLLDSGVMDQAQEILEKYDVGSWNEFHGDDKMVLDGSWFSFHVEFTDGTSLSASGNNVFPENQKNVFSELNDLINPVVDAWYRENRPDEVDDTASPDED